MLERAGHDSSWAAWIDRQAVDVHGVVIGPIVAVFPDPATGRPTALGIDVGGPDALRVVVVPGVGAQLVAGLVVIAHEREMVIDTPAAEISMLAVELGDRTRPRRLM